MQPSATSPYVVVYFGQNPALFGKEATLSQTARSKISLPTPTTTYNFNDYLAALSRKSVFEMAYYKSTAQNPFGGLQAFLNDHRVLFSPSMLRTYFKDDLVSLATRVKDIFGLVDAWTVNDKNELPLVIDRARLTVFRNLRDAYNPSIFKEDVELRSWVQEEEEKALDQGIAQLVSLSDCKFGRPKTPFSTTTTNEDGEEASIDPDHSAINFGPPKQGDKFYLSPPAATSRRNPFTGGAGTSTSKTPPPPPKPTRKSAFSGLETKTGAATPSSGTKIATGTRSAPGTTTSTRTSETIQKPPTKPAKTATKPATASKAPAKISGGASKSSTPAPARPWVLVPRAITATKGSTSTPSTTSTNPRKRTQDDSHFSSVAIASEQESTPASNLRATKERAARSRTLPAIAVLEGSPEPPPAKKQRLVKTEPAPNAQASSSTSVMRSKTKRKAMAGEDDRDVNPQPNYPNAQSLILAKRNGIFANVDTDPAPELRVVEAMAAYTDRVVNGPYPWKCDQCNTSRKICVFPPDTTCVLQHQLVFRGHNKKCDACANMASEAQRARRLRKQADLLIDQAARLQYEADIMTAHNTVAVLQILKMSPDDKKLVDEYRKTDDDIRDIFDNVDKYRKTFDIVVNQFPDLRDPRFSLPSDSQMRSPKKKKPTKPKPKAPTKKGKEKAVEPVEEEEEDFEEEEGQEEEPEMEDEVGAPRSSNGLRVQRRRSTSLPKTKGTMGDTDNTYYPPKSQSEEELVPPTDEEDADGDRDSPQEEEDEDKVFDQLHSSPIRPSILGFEEESEDVELRSWVQEEEEKALDQGIAQLVSLSDCKFGRPKTPFSTTTTNEDGEEASIDPDHSAINFGPPKQGDKFYLSPPAATSRRNPFTGGAGTSTSKTPPPPPKPTRKSAFSGLETKTGAATPSSGTKIATGTRSAPGTTTSTRTSETIQKPPTKPAKTATKPATASKAPAKISGGASKSSTPAPARPWVLVPRAITATKGSTSTPSTTSINPRKRTQDDSHFSSVAIASEQESTPASNLRATKERAARSRTLPAIAVLEGSPEPPPAKKQRLVKTEPAPNAQASSSTSVARTKTKRKAMAGEDDRGRWHRHYNDFPHVNKLPEVNPQPNYPNAQSLILAKRNGIFANVDTDPAPELRVVEAMAAYTDRVVNGPYPWKCDQCNAARKVCVFRGHSKKCDACASARNSCSILHKGFKFFLHQEDAAGRVALAPSHMASEAQRARRLRHEADLLIDHAARLHYEADIMTAHNTVAVLQILKMSPDDKQLVDEYRKTDKDIRDIFDNVDEYRRVFDIVVNEFPDLRDPRFSLPSDSQMKSPKKKKPTKPK
ncbi:hypothetical protein K435DRAFT_812690, partial [Dendrothele bispora CBS 962.96]